MTTVILALDIGNTNMEFGLFEGRELRFSFRLGTNRDATSDEIGIMAAQFFAATNVDRKAVEEVLISSVVPQVMYSVNNAMVKYFGRRPLVVGANLPVRIENRYGNPSEVGSDRLVAALGAYRKYGGPLIVVDFGTATTFDAVSGDGAYLGGAIYPGIKISMDALFQKASKLPKVELVDPGKVIGTTTVSSMQAGAMYGYQGAVLNIVERMRQEMGANAKVIATGGLSQMIDPKKEIFDTIDRRLMLDGLIMIYEDYCESRSER